jgi:hypothetical protein
MTKPMAVNGRSSPAAGEGGIDLFEFAEKVMDRKMNCRMK